MFYHESDLSAPIMKSMEGCEALAKGIVKEYDREMFYHESDISASEGNYVELW